MFRPLGIVDSLTYDSFVDINKIEIIMEVVIY